MSEIWLRDEDATSMERVTSNNPFPVKTVAPLDANSTGALPRYRVNVNTTQYSSGDIVGDLVTIGGALRAPHTIATLHSVLLIDRSNQAAAFTLYFFGANPTEATTVNNGAFAWGASDSKLVAQVPVSTTDWVATNSKATAQLAGLGRVVRSFENGTTLYLAIVTTSTPTYALNALEIVPGFLW